MKEEKKLSMEIILHDIANALSPMVNFPDRIEKTTREMQSSSEYLNQIHQECEMQGKNLGEYLRNDSRGQRFLPALGELCRLKEDNLKRFTGECKKLTRQLSKAHYVVSSFQIRLARDKEKKLANMADTTK